MRLRKIAKFAFLAIALILLLILVWGVAVEPGLIDEKHESAAIPNLPPSWEGKTIGLIADLQIGMWLNNTGTVRRIVQRLIERRPAVVLVAGDLVYKPTGEEEKGDVREEYADPEEYADAREEIVKAVSLVKPLVEAGIPVYVVFGNHDYAMNTPNDIKLNWLAEELNKELEAAGVFVLENEAIPLRLAGQPEGETLFLLGIGPKWANRSNPSAALGQIPSDASRFALMHNPDSFEDFPPGTAPLALAGHTHGGQIRLPFFPKWTWMNLFSKERIYADGWIDGFGQAGNSLYVNRGIGFSVVPIRINCPPEMTLITLHRLN